MPRLSSIGFCAILFAAPAFAQAQDQCPPQNAMRARMAAMISPEQRLMMFADAQKATADGSIDMKDYRAMQRDKIRAMSSEQRQAYFTDLTKRFNALPPAEQKALKEKSEAARAKMARNCPPVKE